MGINFSLNSDGGVVVQQGQAAGGSSNSFSGGSTGQGQFSGSVAGGGLMQPYLQKGDGAYLGVTMKSDEFGKRIAGAVQSHSYGANGSKAPQRMPEKNAFGWGY